MRHAILEISSVPRKQAELKALIAVSRQEQRTSNLLRFVAYNLAVWALIAPMYGFMINNRTTHARVVSSYEVFLPVVMNRK